jgi:hypothetical protein
MPRDLSRWCGIRQTAAELTISLAIPPGLVPARLSGHAAVPVAGQRLRFYSTRLDSPVATLT